ncbi:hypothetical protein PH5382_02086 [Phaeobacter sp. CECT 5382]|nr:hypothetical protein PH5382_02086 [Phaeobacter sp. CECT 5382]
MRPSDEDRGLLGPALSLRLSAVVYYSELSILFRKRCR